MYFTLLSVSVQSHTSLMWSHISSVQSESENINAMESCFIVELEVVILIESDIDIFHVYYRKAARFKTINCIKCYINKHNMTGLDWRVESQFPVILQSYFQLTPKCRMKKNFTVNKYIMTFMESFDLGQ